MSCCYCYSFGFITHLDTIAIVFAIRFDPERFKMSTDFIFDPDLSEEDVRRCLDKLGLEEDINDDTTEEQFCITDGKNYIWFYVRGEPGNNYVTACRYGGNYEGEETILIPIAHYYDVSLLNEHDDKFYEIIEAAEDNKGFIMINLQELIDQGVPDKEISIDELLGEDEGEDQTFGTEWNKE